MSVREALRRMEAHYAAQEREEIERIVYKLNKDKFS